MVSFVFPVYSNAVGVDPQRRSSGCKWRRVGTPTPAIVVAGVPAGGSSGSVTVSAAAEQLRTQLGQLQVEAEATRSKANSARLRFLRLSEAAENLRRQATFCIQNGKENEARELLLQKKMVIQTLDRSKTRIELLDKLLGKLSEAISLKETQLIENLTLLSEVKTVDADQPIHIISPCDQADKDPRKSEFVGSSILKPSGTEQMDCRNVQADTTGKNLHLVDEEATRFSCIEDDSRLNILRKKSSFNSFIEHIDGHLGEIETDLATLLRSLASVMESEQKQKSLKVQHILQILGDISSIRKRIASFIQRKTEEI